MKEELSPPRCVAEVRPNHPDLEIPELDIPDDQFRITDHAGIVTLGNFEEFQELYNKHFSSQEVEAILLYQGTHYWFRFTPTELIIRET